MKVNQLKAGAVLSYISMGLGYLVSIIYTPIMLRLLGQSEYGLYNLVASVVAYLGILNFGFGSAYMRYYSRYKIQEDREKIASLNGMFLIIFSFIGFIAVIAGTILVLNTELIFGEKLTINELSRAKTLMMILVINLAVSFPNIVFNSHITANERFVFQKLIKMIRTVVNPFVVLPILIMGYGSVGMVVTTTVINITVEIINIIYCFKKLNMEISFKNIEISLMKEITVFSSYIFLYMIVDQINWNVDKLILGRIKGTNEVAIYSLGAQLNTYLISISTTISSVFTPRIHRIVAKNSKDKELTNLFIKIGRVQYIFVSLIIVGFLVFGKVFISLWAGINYKESYYVASILMIVTSGALIQNVGIEIRKAQNKHKTPAKFMIIVAMLNILISIPLAETYGAIGCVIGTAIANTVNRFFISVYYQKVVGLDIILFWKEILKISRGLIVPILFAIIIKTSSAYFTAIAYMALILPFTIIHMLAMYFLGMNEYEKRLFLNEKVKEIFKIKRLK